MPGFTNALSIFLVNHMNNYLETDRLNKHGHEESSMKMEYNQLHQQIGDKV